MKKLLFSFTLTLASALPNLAEELAPPTKLHTVIEKARAFRNPSSSHQLLTRFIGRWETSTRLFIGDQISEPEPGVSETAWLMEGRWLQTITAGRTMGAKAETFHLTGYDNFKRCYVTTGISSMDTAMIRSEGTLTPDGDMLILFGRADEYLHGIHDRPFKTIWRFIDDDRLVMELHDLTRDADETKVKEIIYIRTTLPTKPDEKPTP